MLCEIAFSGDLDPEYKDLDHLNWRVLRDLIQEYNQPFKVSTLNSNTVAYGYEWSEGYWLVLYSTRGWFVPPLLGPDAPIASKKVLLSKFSAHFGKPSSFVKYAIENC